jgi:hypothetical protein
MELTAHRDTLIANLSGGQIKRVSLGAELLARPCLLYIDEATSGLDAGTEARMMRLFRRLADEGRSLICITHNVDNVDRCHLALVLVRGRLVYYGPPGEAPAYFGVHRLGEIYDRLADKEPEAWEEQFRQSELYREFVEKRLAVPSGVPEVEVKAGVPFGTVVRPSLGTFLAGLASEEAARSRLPLLADRIRRLAARYGPARERLAPLIDSAHQLRVLTQRYVEMVWGDRRSLRLLLLQAPIVAAFLLLGFAGKPYQEQVPVLRRLEPAERRLLQVADALSGLAVEGDAAQLEAFRQARFTVKGPGGDRQISGAEVLTALEVLGRRPDDLTDREQLRRVAVTVGEGDRQTTITGEELFRVLRDIHESRLLETLLDGRYPIVPVGLMTDPRYTYLLLNILAIAVFWFGCNNASKEIVKEEAIYSRERAFNLRIPPYLGSKFLVLSFLSAVQVLLLLAAVYGVLELLHALLPGEQVPPPEYRLAYLPQYGVLVLLVICGVAMGLLLSACVSSPDRAGALLPYVLIPQIILGGLIVSIQGGVLLALAETLSPVYWGYQAIHRGASRLPSYHPMYAAQEYPVGLACLALAVQTAGLLALTAWFLRRKDVGQA